MCASPTQARDSNNHAPTHATVHLGAANYRAACRGKSKADFISKLSIVEEEADESLFWLEMLTELHAAEKESLAKLQGEASQLVAIMAASKKTARSNRA